MSLVTRLHTFLLPRLRNDAQLLHHLQTVSDAPVIPYLAPDTRSTVTEYFHTVGVLREVELVRPEFLVL
jgi:hypothetical protein